MAGILTVDAVVTLAPPLYWWAGQGSAFWSLSYFIGGAVLVVLSIFVLFYVDLVRGELGSTGPADTPTPALSTTDGEVRA